jgi:hypothetical protein
MTYEYETPGKLIEYEPGLDEKMLSRFVLFRSDSFREKPRRTMHGGGAESVGHAPRAAARILLPWMGIHVEDVLRELRRPRPVLVCTNKTPPSQNREG